MAEMRETNPNAHGCALENRDQENGFLVGRTGPQRYATEAVRLQRWEAEQRAENEAGSRERGAGRA
jgi:hypothetical protein